MDDEHAQFLILLMDAIAGAWLARLGVEVVLKDGSRVRGSPPTPTRVTGEETHDATGQARALHFGGRQVELADVVRFAVFEPDQ